jgi:hypothetical protein
MGQFYYDDDFCSSFINDANHDHDVHVFACFHSTLHYEETWAYFMAIDSREVDFL